MCKNEQRCLLNTILCTICYAIIFLESSKTVGLRALKKGLDLPFEELGENICLGSSTYCARIARTSFPVIKSRK